MVDLPAPIMRPADERVHATDVGSWMRRVAFAAVSDIEQPILPHGRSGVTYYPGRTRCRASCNEVANMVGVGARYPSSMVNIALRSLMPSRSLSDGRRGARGIVYG